MTMMNERLDYDFPRDTGPLTGPAAFPQVPPQVAPQPPMGVDPILGLPVPINVTGMAPPMAPPTIAPRPRFEESIIAEAPTFRAAEVLTDMMTDSPTRTALPPMRPVAGEMLGERQLTPMDQAALPMQAQADLTRTATMGTPVPVNPWDYNPIHHLYRSPFPTTPGTQGFLDWQDPLLQQRWDTGYRPFLNHLAGVINPIYGAYNLYNQFIR